MAKSYAHGPIANNQRKCTDGFCLLLFIFMSLVIFTVTLYSVIFKGVKNLTTPSDSDGKLCGSYDKTHPYLYFPSPHANSITRRVCVSQCPTSNTSLLNCRPNSVVQNCSPTLQPTTPEDQPIEIYPTFLFLDRVCLPEGKLVRQQILDTLQVNVTEEQVSQVSGNWRLILMAVPAAIIITILLMILIRFTACLSIYVVIVAVIVGMFFTTYYLIDMSLRTPADAKIFHKIPASIFYKVVAGICALIGMVVMISICCFRQKINIAISMIKAAARFVNQHWYLFSISIVKFGVTVVFLALWLIEAWGMLKFLEIMFLSHDVRMQDNLYSAIQTLLLVLHVFYLLWGVFFISQSSTFIVSGTVTDWYFQSENMCCSSIVRYTNYHSGSACHGSFYIALFGLLKLLYEWFKPNAQNKNSFLGSVEKCCDFCCCICVSYVFTLINRGAYAFIHLSGRPYCQASFKVLGLRTSEPIISSVMIFLQMVFSFVLRLQIIALTVVAAYFTIKNLQPYSSEITNPNLILFIIGVIAFVVSQIFVSVYVEAADTLAVCFLIDKEDGEDDDRCPEELRDYLQQTRKNDGLIE